MQDVTTRSFSFPSTTSQDVLTEVLRQGAQASTTAIEAEVAQWIGEHEHLRDQRGHRQVVRNGYLPERMITTGIGPVKIRQPRVMIVAAREKQSLFPPRFCRLTYARRAASRSCCPASARGPIPGPWCLSCTRDAAVRDVATRESTRPVIFSGRHETEPRDGGPPVVLIAAALGVSPEVFREAFSGVTPAHGRGPTSEEARRNKEALLRVLAPQGVTNERLDEVSDYYRYRPERDELWRTTPAEGHVIV